MSVRTSRKTVTFTRPFSLTGIDEVQPAGPYTVETDEEELPGSVVPRLPARRDPDPPALASLGRSWRRPSTSIRWSCRQLRKKMPASKPWPITTAAISAAATA